MRYLLTLMFTLLAASTAMAEPFVCTDVLQDSGFFCELTDANGNEVGSGCFVFAESTQASGMISAVLEVFGPEGQGPVVSTWECGCGTREPEETVLCQGVGPVFFPFVAVAGGEVIGDDLVLDTVGITGAPGPGGIAVCVRNPECGS